MAALSEQRSLPERAPEVGELVQVRSRRWLVEEALPPVNAGASALISLACADDDAQGQSLEVFWDYELNRRILEEEGWQDLILLLKENSMATRIEGGQAPVALTPEQADQVKQALLEVVRGVDLGRLTRLQEGAPTPGVDVTVCGSKCV